MSDKTKEQLLELKRDVAKIENQIIELYSSLQDIVNHNETRAYAENVYSYLSEAELETQKAKKYLQSLIMRTGKKDKK